MALLIVGILSGDLNRQPCVILNRKIRNNIGVNT
jgi:hypothetical protein